jgi:CO/xanthine dehydrogenase Mo-binding subunit
MAKLKVVGKPHPRLDGFETVSGQATYTVDVVPPGALQAKLLRSPLPHAKITRLDTSRARALPGVAAVLTADHVPSTRFGFSLQDEQIFAGAKVRYVGDVIAAVAADNESSAEQALDLIDCRYEELPAVLTADQALGENAPLVQKICTPIG